MKKIYPIVIFIVLQLITITSLTLWIVWYQLGKDRYEGIMVMAKDAFTHLEVSVPGVGNMVLGILFISFIFIGSLLIFIEWVKARNSLQQGMDFLSAFTHELMTPLTCIQLNIETLQTKKNLEDETKNKLLDTAFDEVKRLENSINKILDIQRLERNKAVIEKQPFQINRFFDSYLQRIKAKHTDLNINPDISCNDDHYFMVDQSVLSIVFDNIVENAKKYSLDNPRLDIEGVIYKNRLILKFRDYGIGLDAKKAKKIFSIFYRENRNIRGTGVGLYISKMIIRRHGGKIKAISFGENMGTTFVVSLPIINRSKYE